MIKDKQQSEKTFKILYILIIVCFFIFAFAICLFINYSDGDDAFFISYTEQYGFIDFIKILTYEMNTRVTTTITLFFIFSSNILVWRVLNAFFLTSLIVLAERFISIIILYKSYKERLISFISICICFICIGTMTIGYSSFWITGSINYLWPLVIGLLSLCPLIIKTFKSEYRLNKYIYIASSFFGVWACLAQEQISALLVGFGIILLFSIWQRDKTIPFFSALQVTLMFTAFIILLITSLSGNRSELSMLQYLPSFNDLSFSSHVFIILQWLCYGISGQLNLLYLFICVLMGLLLFKNNSIFDKTFGIILFLFAATSLPIFNDFGPYISDYRKIVIDVPTFDALSLFQRASLIWMLFKITAIPFIMLRLTRVARFSSTGFVIYFGGLVTVLIMGLSPTMYASGERVFFVFAVMLLFILASLITRIKSIQLKICSITVIGVSAIIQFIYTFNDMLLLLRG